MDTVRFIIASLLVATLPPALLFWYVAHPLAAFWRRQHPVVTYTVLMGLLLGSVVGLWLFRGVLVGPDLGYRSWVVIPSAALYLAAIGIEVQCRQYLKVKVLIGVPELTGDGTSGELLDQGIYARVRHPRYLGIILAVLGWSLFSSYLGAVVVSLAMIPGLYLVTVLEERELVERFGDDYVAYRTRVPRLIPRLRRPA